MIKKAILTQQKILNIILILIVISLTLAIFRVTYFYQWTGREALPTPTPTPPSVRKIATPSAYATDSAVLKVETNLKAIEGDLKATDLREAGLMPPILDMEVEFEE